MKYLISFKGIKKGESQGREHNIVTETPKSMEKASDEALEALAKMLILGTKAYSGVSSILIEED